MYDYTDLSGVPTNSISSTAWRYGDAVLDDNSQFTTLTVEGLEGYQADVKTAKIDGADGALFLRRELPPREIRIQIKLSNNDDVKLAYDQLKKEIITKTPIWHSFAHYPGEEVFGIVKEITEEDPAATKEVVAGVYISCYDPYIYSSLKTATDGQIVGDYDEYRVEEIQATVSAQADSFTITNSTKNHEININYVVKVGDIVTYDFNEGTIKVNNTNVTGWIDFATSYFHDFDASNGTSITTTNGTISKVVYRGRRL